MQRSLFKKYLTITSFTILISFFLLGLVMLSFTTANWQDEKQILLEKNARSVADIAGRNTEKISEGQYVISSEDGVNIQSFMTAFSENIDSDILIVDSSGNVIASAFANKPIPELRTIPPELMAKALRGQYIGQSTLGDIYPYSCYVVGVPLEVQEEGGVQQVGAVFAACTFRSFGEYRANLIQMFLLAAVAAFMVSFCIVWLYCYNLVRPLRDMAVAARNFGEGNFSIRVPVSSQDEVGQLAAAFNNMASSLASGENVRRNFIANVSHELKTPMTTIAGFIDGILDGTIPREKQKQYLQIVSQEVKRLSRLVRTMLDLSRIDSGELHIRSARFDLTATVFNTLLTFEKPIEEKKLDIRGLAEAESVFVDGDPDMIHQVVYNLVENAVKFTDLEGYIDVRIRELENRISFVIRNSGAGIPSEELSMIFDRFYKTDKSRSKDKTGMGLGLYIVRTIIRLHGGEITASSVENEYCQFEFWLPKAPEPPALKDAKTSDGAKASGEKRKNGKNGKNSKGATPLPANQVEVVWKETEVPPSSGEKPGKQQSSSGTDSSENSGSSGKA